MKNFLPVILCFLAVQSTAQNFSLSFNGTNQYVSIPDQNSIDLSSNFTIESWIYPTGAGSHGTEGGIIINKENSYEIARFTDGTLRYALSANGAGNDWAWINTGMVAPLNTWTHFALVKSGTTVNFYLAGSAPAVNISNPATLTANTQLMQIGARAGGNQYFNGAIEELRIWNTARTQAEIKTNVFNRNLPDNATGLVAYYRMNEGSGTSTANSNAAVTGIDGTLVNGPAWTASPVQYAPNALSFDGADDHIIIPDDNTLDITTAITLETWCYATKNSGVQNVISKSNNTSNNGYIFPRTDNGWASVVIYIHIAGGWRTLSASYPSLNAWHHLAATYDGAFIHLYINGVLVASLAQTGAITSNGNPLAFGTQPGFGEYFGGNVDEMRIWNVARTQVEIQSNMNRELDPALQTGLASYYTFNQGIAAGTNTGLTKVMDQKGINNGTLNNFALSGASSNFLTQAISITTLPVSWLGFTAQKKDNTVELNWSTANEQNSREFIVQHSSNGSSYNSIGNIAAAGNSAIRQQYSFVHSNPVSGTNYYRILQQDIDGRSDYSKVVSIVYPTQNRQIIAYPNPVTDGALNLQLTEAATITLYNSSGELVMSRKLAAGTQLLNMSHLAKGIYRLKAGNETISIVIR
ncbi:MAG: LamG-like jellyroll fold domain-containing protein [Chitinophagaceae bacterium]